MTASADHARTFLALHAGPQPLILPNAWDAASARLAHACGAPAIATSSAAVAWTHGYADGHHLPVDALVGTVREIARVSPAPVSTDIEGGYADDLRAVEETAARVLDAGAVGVNIEDGTGAPDLLCRKIEAVRRAADRAGVALFINARTDVFLRKLAEGEAALAETIRRGALYREAGADGLFVPFVKEPAAIGEIVRSTPLPVNVIAMKGLPALAELTALGVRRLSAGTAMARAAYEAMRVAAAQFLADGDSEVLITRAGALPDMNALVAGKA